MRREEDFAPDLSLFFACFLPFAAEPFLALALEFADASLARFFAPLELELELDPELELELERELELLLLAPEPLVFLVARGMAAGMLALAVGASRLKGVGFF